MIGECERCGDDIEELNVESWEVTGAFLCAGCTEEAFESHAEHDLQKVASEGEST